MDQMKTDDKEIRQDASVNPQPDSVQDASADEYIKAEEAFEKEEPQQQKEEQAENEKKYGKSIALPVAEHGGQGLVLGGGGAR